MDDSTESRKAPETMYTLDSKSDFVFSASSTLDSPISFENRIEDGSIPLPVRPRRSKGHLWWPLITTCAPMILLCLTLLLVVLGHQIKPTPNLFDNSQEQEASGTVSYILVNYSDTKIVFMASFLSTIAPLLAGGVMALASVSLFKSYRSTVSPDHAASTSDPDQLRDLMGLTAASYRQLLISSKVIFHRSTTRTPRPIVYAASLLLLTVLMAIAVTVADAALHMLTKTVGFTLYLFPASPESPHGRGLNAYCADFDRVGQNWGFPCTVQMNTDLIDPNIYSEQAESQKLAHNTSETQEIRFSPKAGTDEADVAFILPRASQIDADLDYEATTVGMSAKCSLIPAPSCNVSRWGPYDNVYTSFNCSANFWGVLGLSENTSAVNSIRQPSPYLPLLALKPQSNLEYSFFTDPALTKIYNPAGLNDSGLNGDEPEIVSDASLPRTIHMAFAWRAAWSTFIGGESNEMIANPANLTGIYPGVWYLDYFVSCAMTSYEVRYVWANQTVQAESVTASPFSNGTLLNMWQATTPYRPSINGGGIALQDINSQAAVAGDTIAAFESRFGELLAQSALAKVGGYMSPRAVERQQRRRELLLARVPKASLAALIACSLLYPALGMGLLALAHRSLRSQDQETGTDAAQSRAQRRFTRRLAKNSETKTIGDVQENELRIGTGDIHSEPKKTNARFSLWNHNHLQPFGVGSDGV